MTATGAHDFLYPLTRFHENGDWPLPSVELVDATALPEPYRTLLVHEGDMTSRLESFHGGSIALQVLHQDEADGAYHREVLLRVGTSGLAVEYGAIQIDLESFDAQLRAHILEGRVPLGGLLNRFDINYRSQPKAFIRIAADERMCALFGTDCAEPLYGRSNVLLGAEDRVLARIVEVLRP